MNKILFIISNRVHLARQKRLLEFLGNNCVVEEVNFPEKDDDGDIINMWVRAGDMYFEAERLITEHKPDIVLIRGDRFTELATAAVATYLGKVIAHIEGGDVSSSVDEHVRHAVTKLAQIHFPSNEPAKERLLRMGENPEYVFNFGSLDAEFAMITPKKRLLKDPYFVFLHHEIKGEEGSSQKIWDKLKEAYPALKGVWLKSNNDFVDENGKSELDPEKFISLLAHAEFLAGNSSASLKEASVLGIPALLFGSRQAGRFLTENIIYTSVKATLPTSLEIQLHRITDETYYQDDTAEKVARVLLNIKVPVQKMFYD